MEQVDLQPQFRGLYRCHVYDFSHRRTELLGQFLDHSFEFIHLVQELGLLR